MANFETIVEWLIYQEDSHRVPGKIVDLGDGAGLTRFGITSNNFGQVVPTNFFTTMPFGTALEVAKNFYQSQHWHHINGDKIAHDEIAAPLLSFAVNKSVPTAVKHLQRVLGLQEDGVLGLNTLSELNSKDPVITAKLFRADWENYYRQVASVNPNDAQFLDGWIALANFPYPSPLVGSIYA